MRQRFYTFPVTRLTHVTSALSFAVSRNSTRAEVLAEKLARK
jgi:hypothetical protein